MGVSGVEADDPEVRWECLGTVEGACASGEEEGRLTCCPWDHLTAVFRVLHSEFCEGNPGIADMHPPLVPERIPQAVGWVDDDRDRELVFLDYGGSDLRGPSNVSRDRAFLNFDYVTR